MTQKAEERREYKGRWFASDANDTMVSRLGAVLIVGLGALALGVNGEAAPCAPVLGAGKFRRGEAESAVVKRCEEDSTSTTSTKTSTTEPVNCACCNYFIGPVSESPNTFFYYYRGQCRNPIDKLQDDAYVTLTCGVMGSYTHNYKYYGYDTTDGKLNCYTVETADLLDSKAERLAEQITELKQCALWDEDEEGCNFA